MCPAPVIETPRLLLRPWRDSDVQPFIEMYCNAPAREFLVGPWLPYQAARLVSLFRNALEENGYGHWVAEIKDGLTFAGLINLQKCPFEAPFTPAHEVGWELLPAVRAQGYAAEGARAILDFGFRTLGLSEIVAVTSIANIRSQKVAERLGMIRDPNGDFDHPDVPQEHPYRRQALYRIKNWV